MKARAIIIVALAKRYLDRTHHASKLELLRNPKTVMSSGEDYTRKIASLRNSG